MKTILLINPQVLVNKYLDSLKAFFLLIWDTNLLKAMFSHNIL